MQHFENRAALEVSAGAAAGGINAPEALAAPAESWFCSTEPSCSGWRSRRLLRHPELDGSVGENEDSARDADAAGTLMPPTAAPATAAADTILWISCIAHIKLNRFPSTRYMKMFPFWPSQHQAPWQEGVGLDDASRFLEMFGVLRGCPLRRDTVFPSFPPSVNLPPPPPPPTYLRISPRDKNRTVPSASISLPGGCDAAQQSRI